MEVQDKCQLQTAGDSNGARFARRDRGRSGDAIAPHEKKVTRAGVKVFVVIIVHDTGTQMHPHHSL